MQFTSILYRLILITLLQFVVTLNFASGTDKNKLKEFNARADEIMDDSPEEAIKLLKQVIANSDGTEFRDVRAKALKSMGVLQYHQQNFRQSQEYYEQALAIYKQLDDQDGIASVLNNIGLIYERQGDFTQALKKYNDAATMFGQLTDSRKQTIALSNIGNVYYTLGRFDKALEFLSEALSNSEELKDSSGMAPSYNNIGNIYLSLKDWKSAIEFYTKAEKIHLALNEKQKLSTVYNNIGEAYLGLNKIPEALRYNQLSLEIANKNNDSESVISSLINISDIYTSTGEYKQAMENYQEAMRLSNIKPDPFLQSSILKGIGALKLKQGDLDAAITSYKGALNLIEKTGSDLLLQEIYSGLSDAWEAKGNYERAFQYLSKHQEITDSIYNKESLNRFNMVRVSFELERTERDNQMLRQQNLDSQLALSRQETIRYFLIIISAIILVSLAFLFLLYHSKKKKNELLALRNHQISQQKEELDKLYNEQYKLNETKAKFFSIVAHDLKSPFQSLLGFSELLSMEYDQFTDEQRLDAIQNMYKVTSDTYKLIENLLEWGRIQTGNANPVLKHLNLMDLVDSIVPLFTIPLRNKNLTLKVDIPPILMAFADYNMMSAVLRNLLSNAVKFSNPDGIIEIKGMATQDSAKLSVKDSGIGMSPDVIDKLFTFDPKVRRVGTKGETGTGMGLGLCMEFMLLNHGMIKVTSVPREGSTFTMIMQPGAKVALPQTEDSVPQMGSASI
ncbi:MAG TPA: tetratricopeptide repeat protein [Lentimicrobium sp.]|nr:tetratricopeptide repeat protein [Lentimicrobium sp.]